MSMFDSVTDKINNTGQFFDKNLSTIGGVVNQAKAIEEKIASKPDAQKVVVTTPEKQAIAETKSVPVWAWFVIGGLALVVVVGGIFGRK